VLELCLSRGGYFVSTGETLPRTLTHAVDLYGVSLVFVSALLTMGWTI
jgi:hypothetical protein